jgi:hypothetical protein
MLTEVKPQECRTKVQTETCSQRPNPPIDGLLAVPRRKQLGFAVTSLAGMKGIRAAYEMATDEWVGAD